MSLFGGMRTDLSVLDFTRGLMKQYPATYRSARMMLKHAAKEMGFKMDQLAPDQREILETLFSLAPDIDRAARKVRAEDAAAKGESPEEDPFGETK